MRSWKKLALAACIVAGLVAAYVLMQERQPRFRGHMLSYWLLRTQLDTEGTNDYSHDLQIALDHLGTNATPFLLKWIRYERPNWRDALYNWAPAAVDHFFIAQAERRADACEQAFIYLGTNAVPAMAELARMAYDTNATDTADRAMSALACIGPEGIHTLLAIAQATNNANSLRAMRPLGQHTLQNNPGFDRVFAESPLRPLRIAALAQLMGETNLPDIRMAAVAHMGQQTDLPALALPPLTHSANSETSDAIRVTAVISLNRFGTNALPALTNALIDPAPRVRRAASNAIQNIVPAPSQLPGFRHPNEHR